MPKIRRHVLRKTGKKRSLAKINFVYLPPLGLKFLPVLRIAAASTAAKLFTRFFAIIRLKGNAMAAILSSKDSQLKAHTQWRQARRQESITRLIDLLQYAGEQPIRVAELCRSAGVSERTLRSIFIEVFGVGPNRYMLIRRLHLMRAALSIANPATESVSQIALRFGFTDNGRMAAAYHAMFGEFPSKTLTRPFT